MRERRWENRRCQGRGEVGDRYGESKSGVGWGEKVYVGGMM